jgi:hypothetical protein
MANSDDSGYDDSKAQLLKKYVGGIGNLPASAFNTNSLANIKRIGNPNAPLPGPHYESYSKSPEPTNMGEFTPQPAVDPLSMGSPGAIPAAAPAMFPKLQNKIAPQPPMTPEQLAAMFPNDPSAPPEMSADQLKMLNNIKGGN